MLERALELAERGRGTTHPNPVVGAVVVRDGEIVGEGWHERKGGPHAEAVALDTAGEAARGATMFVTLEPCDHHGSQPPCVDADPPRRDREGRGRCEGSDSRRHRPSARGGRRGRAADLWEARAQNEAWLTWARLDRPFVTYKAAVTLDGRMTLPGERWISGEESRRLVHELRAASDAVAVGMGTVRADDPRLDAREVDAQRQPRRLAFGQGPLPADSELELLTGPLEDELSRLAGENVQSLLLEGGPTLAAAFFHADLVDKLLLFVAPKLSGEGPGLVAGLPEPVTLTRLSAQPVGQDVLLTAYVHEP